MADTAVTAVQAVDRSTGPSPLPAERDALADFYKGVAGRPSPEAGVADEHEGVLAVEVFASSWEIPSAR